MKPKLIAFLTDFGTSDAFVGIMKAVISEISAQARWIDLTHQIPPGDIKRGAFVLWQAAREFPAGTVFLAVVDPGVGTQRKALILEAGDQIFIGPDNGLFSYILIQRGGKAWELSDPRFQRQSVSTTFHGRDLFAPAAAYAAEGIPGYEFGSEVADLVTLPEPMLAMQDRSLIGEILAADQFGNVITSIGHLVIAGDRGLFSSWLSREQFSFKGVDSIKIRVQGRSLPLAWTFDSIPAGELAGVVGSTGLVEIAANRGSAQEMLGVKVGDPVTLSWE